MKNHFISVSLLSALLLATHAFSDTFTLKNGTVLEGKVLKKDKSKEGAEVWSIEYQVTSGIKDVKLVPKDQIAKVTAIKLDDKAFEAISKLVPTPDLLATEDYQQRIDLVKAFLKKYPKAKKTKDAEAMLKTLTDEAAKVAAGGRKFDGLMVSQADYLPNAYDMDARVVDAKFRTAAKNAQWLAALRAFAELDKDFQGSASWRAAVPTALKAMQTLKAQVAASLATFDARVEKQAAELEAMPLGDRANIKRALDEEAALLEARYQTEKTAQQAWVTPHANHRQALEDCVSFADSEIQRLATPPDAAITDPGKAYRAAWKILKGDKVETEAVDKAMTDAQASGLSEKYLTLLKDAAPASAATPTEEP
jgi:hypothetical protein